MKEKETSGLTLLRYPGGKFYALKMIKPFLDAVKYDEYREPFFGGGAVFWGIPKAELNWINDKECNLINLLNVIKDSKKRNSLLEFFSDEMEATKEKYAIVKNMIPTNEIEQAYKFYYLNRTSFSGKMKSPSWGYRPKRSVPPYRWHEKIVPCGEKLQDVKITNLDFEEVINAPARGKSVLLFLDPPYYEANQESHYICPFSNEDHIRLSNILKNCKHKFVLTYDDCEEIRKLYSWAHIYEMKFFYRLDNSKDNDDRRKKGSEVIITNFDAEKGE